MSYYCLLILRAFQIIAFHQETNTVLVMLVVERRVFDDSIIESTWITFLGKDPKKIKLYA